ncbi:hypothetical protein P8C59_005673 [Phyllachora maydis]|uniref:CDP-diacylglycerol--inositol 3-phosphatidyltransferase n=1 Tax=Phyllachora maydis TaxID=1825666 RepID=A0AAD9I5B0_9PEZI|nr:hypothetical protein P8C59_005673 [Phyllachora maydis]
MSGRKTRRKPAAAEETASHGSAQAAPAPTPTPAAAAAAAADDDDNNNTDEPSRENIFLFVPNVIGYTRIVLAVASLYYMPLHPRTCTLLYSVSCLLDALDGYAARLFAQATRFGAVLDMVTDRCTTTCLLVFLSTAFPRWIMALQGLVALDLASHYTHMYATLALGGPARSHKHVDRGRSRLLNLYYSRRAVLFALCALNEAFFLALYLLSFSSPLLAPALLQHMADSDSAAVRTGGQVSSKLLGQIFTNPYSAGALELARANKIDSTGPWIVAAVSLPGMLLKQIINLVQLVKACRWLAEGDVEARRAQGLLLPRAHKAKAA